MVRSWHYPASLVCSNVFCTHWLVVACGDCLFVSLPLPALCWHTTCRLPHLSTISISQNTPSFGAASPHGASDDNRSHYAGPIADGGDPACLLGFISMHASGLRCLKLQLGTG